MGAAERLSEVGARLLEIPVSSQTLVFSKTSFQYRKISPQTPRALYFNDDVYVGKVHDGKAIEIVSFDAQAGRDLLPARRAAGRAAGLPARRARLHALPRRRRHAQRPRRADPLDLPDADRHAGRADAVVSSPATRARCAKRFGGWYVTGTHGAADAHGQRRRRRTATHPGRSIAPPAPTSAISPSRFDTSRYLTPHSDIVAQLVQAHQTQMHNLITLTNYQTRIALHEEAAKNRAAG